MDIQRLIAFVVFSFSALLLWDAWQKHNAPAGARAAGVPLPASPPRAPPRRLPFRSRRRPLPASAPAATPAAPAAAPVEATGQPVIVKTDLFEVELNTAGGDIRRVTLFKVFSALDRTQAAHAARAGPEAVLRHAVGVARRGPALAQGGLHAPSRTRTRLADGKDQVEVRLVAKDVSGAEVVKKFVFRRGTYEILVSYEVKNAGDKPIAPHAYFQFLRDGNQPSQEAAQTSAIAGVATFTGPAVYTDESKFVKVDFKDIEKGKQTHPKKAKDGWIAMVQHYFVSAWLPKGATEREFFTNRVGDNLYAAGVIVPVGAVAPGASATIAMPLYIGPQETEKLAKIAPGPRPGGGLRLALHPRRPALLGAQVHPRRSSATGAGRSSCSPSSSSSSSTRSTTRRAARWRR